MQTGTTRPAETREAAPDIIFVEDLRVHARVGVHDFERERTQTLRFDVELVTVPGYRDHVRGQAAYVSYADTVEFILAQARSGPHIELVEHWAEDVAAFALANPLVEEVAVRVSKPDIFPQAAGVGVRVRRRRAQ